MSGRTGGLAVLVLVVAGCTPVAGESETAAPASAPPPQELVLLDFDEGATPVGGIVASVSNNGVADLKGELVTTAGGRVRRSEGRESGYAVRLPAFDEGDPSTALLLLRPLGDDALAPGTADFALGADVMLDVESTGSSDDTTDNGDNVLQRGFALDPAQLKLQVDGGTASCRVTGTAGTAVVEADTELEPERWYRVSCTRTGDELSLHWEDLEDPALSGSSSVTAPTGSVRFPRSVPMTVGGKSDSDGRAVRSSSDQFNGCLDNVWFDVLDES